MGSILGADIVNTPEVLSTTSLRIPGLTRVTVGGRQVSITNPVLNTGVVGVGGLDVGPLQVHSNYNLFMVYSGGSIGLVGSVAEAPIGFPIYAKVGGFFTGSPAIIHYAINLAENNKVVLSASGSVTGGGAWTSDEYGATNASTLMGRGLWQLHGSVSSGNTGVGQGQVFQQLLFADVDGDNTTSQPVGTELATYQLSNTGRSTVFGQITGGANFNSMGNNSDLTLNIPNFFRCYATGRQQCSNPTSSVMFVAITARKIGPYLG